MSRGRRASGQAGSCVLSQERDIERTERSPPIDATIRFTDQGLTLAGTILAGRNRADGKMLPALLTVAHERPVDGRAIALVRRAAKHANAGEHALAAACLALSGANRLARPVAGARRLKLAERLLQAGFDGETVIKLFALRDPLQKYRPDQPRVPAGSGRASGEWTSGGGGGSPSSSTTTSHPHPDRSPRGHKPSSQTTAAKPATPSRATVAQPQKTEPFPRAATLGARANPGEVVIPAVDAAPSINLGAMSAAALSRLASFIGRLSTTELLGAVAGGFGLALIPTDMATGQWVKLPGPGDVSMFRSPNVPGLTFRYTTRDGVQREWRTTVGANGAYPGPDGRDLARWARVAGKLALVVSTAALLDQDADEPRLCPAAEPDRGGEGGARYEDYMKALYNPGNPTPHKMAYQFIDSRDGDPVMIDDCQHRTGNVAEYKGPGYLKNFLRQNYVWNQQLIKMLYQADLQVHAKGARHITWFFAEKPVADYMRTVFATIYPEIEVVWHPIPGD